MSALLLIALLFITACGSVVDGAGSGGSSPTTGAGGAGDGGDGGTVGSTGGAGGTGGAAAGGAPSTGGGPPQPDPCPALCDNDGFCLLGEGGPKCLEPCYAAIANCTTEELYQLVGCLDVCVSGDTPGCVSKVPCVNQWPE